MLLLAKLGPDGLRERLRKQQQLEMQGLAFESPVGKPGAVNRSDSGGMSTMLRKVNAAQRLLVDANRHQQLVAGHICKHYPLPEVRTEILKCATLTKNILRQVTNAVAVTYQRPPTRNLTAKTKRAAKVFAQAYRDAKTNAKAEQWARYAFLLRVVHVIPRIEDSRLVWVTVLPTHADVLFDEDTGEDEPSILVYETCSHGAKFVALDSERWWWLDASFNVLIDEPHGMGMRPWATLRWEQPPPGDYWDVGGCQDLYEGTLELARLQAHGKWIRKSYAKKTEMLRKEDTIKIPEGQNVGANVPLVVTGQGSFEYGVHDTIVSPEYFIQEQSELTETLLEGYGLPPGAIRVGTATGADARFGVYEALAKIRDKSIKLADDFEHELAERAVAVLNKNGLININPSEVRDYLHVTFAPLSYADTPKARAEAAQALFSLGATNHYEFYMQEHPGTTFEEAKEAVDQNYQWIAECNAMLVKYNSPAEPEPSVIDQERGLLSPAQQNGMVGGVKSGVVRSADDSDSENE